MKKKLIAICCLAIVTIIAFVGYMVHGLSRLAAEDRIPHAYFPVINAIGDYCETNHVAPTRLEDLVPQFLSELPSNTMSEAVSYQKMDDGTNWTLGITAKIRQERWIYFRSSEQNAHPLCSTNEIGGFHTWRIFRETEKELPQIYTTHWEMPDPVQVLAQFKKFAVIENDGRKYKGYTFTIIQPDQYKGKEVSFSLNWREFDTAKLIPRKKYLITVPRENIGTNDLVCDWGLEYKEPK